MQKEKIYLAADLGAGSGRVMAGRFDGETLTIEEVSRFVSEAVEIRGSLYWDIPALFHQVRQGFLKGLHMHHSAIVSAAVDTWGVDYGLLDSSGNLLGLPYAYRDPRTNGKMEAAAGMLPPQELYQATGLQTIFFNTLYQLMAEKERRGDVLELAENLLFTPDLINYWLTGEMANERTIASTSQLLDPRSGDWSQEIIGAFGLPAKIFGDLVDSGQPLGVAHIDEFSLPIVTVGSHDTASAVAGAPLTKDSAFLSSGTWSLLGFELPAPVLTEDARRANFTNEGGVDNTIRFLKNITGLWLIQGCKSEWNLEDPDLDYDTITHEANEALPFKGFIDPDAEIFAAPGKMPGRIAEYLREHHQPSPKSRGALARLIYENLALKYRYTLERLEKVAGRRAQVLNVVGGGCRNHLLNQFTANVTCREVIAGPAEATATGNILMQMIADGQLSNIAEGRELVRTSFAMKSYEPENLERWEEAFGRFCAFLKSE
jgi:rhamnulokinase